MALYRWIEVRPVSSIEYEPRNFSSVLEVLYNARKPFRFIASSVKTGFGRNIVHFYIQAEEDLINRLANLLRSWLGVQVLMDSKPPSEVYDLCVEYGLRSHYALPIADLDGKPEENNIDGIIAALASEGGAFEVTAVADIGARRGVYDWIRRKMGRSASFSDTILDHAYGAVGAILGGPYKPSGGGGIKQQTDPIAKLMIDAVSKKAVRSLFNCSIKAYGSMDLIKAVLEALPSSSMNRLTPIKSRRGVALSSEIVPPKKHSLRNFINTISPAFTIAILACAFLTGLITLRLTDFEILIIVLSIIPTLLIKIFLPKKKPLILSTDELSMIVGMPSGIGRLPVETALAPPTREVVPVERSTLLEKREAVIAESKREERKGLIEAEKAMPFQWRGEPKNCPTDTSH